MTRWFETSLLTLMAIILVGTTRMGDALAQGTNAVSVGTVMADRKPITQTRDFVGRVDAIERVDIRARVTGFLQKVMFKEGDLVHEGDPLYQIEPDSFEAAVLQARGALYRAQAAYSNATLQRARTEELVKTNAAPRAEFDRQVAAEKAAQGEVITADANLKTAMINLGYTNIVAPIAGEIGRTAITPGNVVGPDSGPLTTIVSRDPMYVTFPVSQREFLTLQDAERRTRQATLDVHIRFSNGTQFPQTGRINFVDVAVNRATDTVLVRATMPDPQGTLIDGQLVRVAVAAAHPEEKVVVPQAALIADQQGVYVFVVVDGKAVVQRVKPGGEQGSSVIVDDGLKGGEQVVIQGMETLRPGVQVVASPVSPQADRS